MLTGRVGGAVSGGRLLGSLFATFSSSMGGSLVLRFGVVLLRRRDEGLLSVIHLPSPELEPEPFVVVSGFGGDSSDSVMMILGGAVFPPASRSVSAHSGFFSNKERSMGVWPLVFVALMSC